MIIVRLQGGTGNQMFQYATGRALALRNNVQLKLDLSFLKKGKLEETVEYRDYGLHAFNIEGDIISEDQLDAFLKKCRRNSKLKINAVNRLLFDYKLPVKKKYSENGRQFNPSVCKMSRNTYLDGYWQTPSYFYLYSDQIRKDFTICKPPDVTNQKYLAKIEKKSESVAVHVRKGDFEKIDKLGVTDTSFYIEAINQLADRLHHPSYYMFGNDISWLKKEFQQTSLKKDLNFVDINIEASKHVNDIRLMSQCKHQIIGNSTFAWWGAWLNENPDKIIIAPKKIFNDVELNRQIQDMIPDNWERI